MTTAPLNPPKEAFLKLAEHGKLVPVYTEFVADYETPVGVLEKIDDGRRTFLFESAETSRGLPVYQRAMVPSPPIAWKSAG